jgi:hypothetical protein
MARTDFVDPEWSVSAVVTTGTVLFPLAVSDPVEYVEFCAASAPVDRPSKSAHINGFAGDFVPNPLPVIVIVLPCE